MAEPKRIDYKRIENHLKSFMDKPQWESNMRAIQNFDTKMDEIHAELRKADVTKRKLADLLPNRQDLLPRWKRLPRRVPMKKWHKVPMDTILL